MMIKKILAASIRLLYLVTGVVIFSSCKKEYSCEKCAGVQTAEGNVVFYAVSTCVNSKPIHLIIDGNLHLLVDVSPARPDCSAIETSSILLSPGIHSWEATCDLVGTIAGGVIDVLPGATCQVEQIK